MTDALPLRLWRHLPVLPTAVAGGVVVASAGTVVWARLISANLAHFARVPWAVPIMAAWLAAYWLYFVRGSGWPRGTGATRRGSARANMVSDQVWGTALLAGMLGLVCILLLQGVMSHLVTLPQQRDLDPSQYPLPTVFAWVVMSALVAGVVEETAFRGYLQRPIERRYGPATAIAITGIVFAFAHFSHPEVGLSLLPYYMAVAAVYGMLAYLTDSTLPSMVLHTGGNLLSAFDLFTRGRSEWNVDTAPRALVWQRGVDASFVANVAAFLVVGALTILAYVSLARATRTARAPSSAAQTSRELP